MLRLRASAAAATVALLAAALALGAGEAVQPAVTVTIGDGARLIGRWQASAYRRWWDHAALAAARAELDKGLAVAEAELGIAPLDVLAGSHGVDLRFFGMRAEDQPIATLQAVLGANAEALFALLRRTVDGNRDAAATLLDEPAPAGADEAFTLLDGTGGNRTVFARFQGTIVVAVNPVGAVLALPAPTDDADASFTLDADALRAGLAPLASANEDPEQLEAMLAMYGDAEAQLWIVPEGMRLVSRQSGYTELTAPVDRALLARLPGATTALAAAAGVHGQALWALLRDRVLPMVAQAQAAGRGAPPEVATIVAEADDALAGLGIAVGVEEVVTAFDGTCVIALSNAAPFPGLTIALPRSPAVDRLVEGLVRLADAQAPAEGASTMLALGIPVPLSVGRGIDHWVASNDATMVAHWLAPQPGAWDATVAGAATLAAAPATTTALSGIDLGQIVRMATPWIGMGLAQMGDHVPAEVRQPLLTLLADLGDEAGVERSATWIEGDAHVSEYRGLLGGGIGGVGAIAVVAAIAVPNLLESRVTANEAAAAAALKSGLFPAQVQFQGGCYSDEDGDDIGSYGFLREMSGAQPVAGGLELRLLPGGIGQGESDGYRFAVFLPNGNGGAIIEPLGMRPRVVVGADQRERYWVGYAWPISADHGRQVFAIDQTGVVHVLPSTGEPPAWNALYGDAGTWGDEPAWPRHHR
ncbi:MAG TPA: hypothetical protein VEL07_13285 [Planctomycetota bacterium]|nr:hypothetical protein [Planctomycetota bacterium]